ncbi:CotH kinase family protein [Vitiosangium sp. GDMCC 1.1324]|uniref:CotH kinase family protein n=1 Tax=Vitiosangium sp. (strain GDMCC 1.1324) TaxID=2138576 RepID=UPI00130ECC75|nr:CotH kinase family protein [Vitiosangium sp. GDMCC 1.1324]
MKGSDVHLEHLPRGAHYDKKSATLLWTPGLDQAGVYEITLKGKKKQVGAVKIGVADNWSHPRNVPVDPARYTEEYGLPVIHIQGASQLNPDAHVPITIIYRGHTYAAEGKLRGSSSLAFPKNSYTLKFSEQDPFNEPELGGAFSNRRSLVLVNTFNDNSYLRTRLGFELWGRLSPESLQVKTYSAVVFLDGAYHGLYTVADHVNKHLMAAQGPSVDGNLYKADTGSANFRLVDKDGRPKPHPHVGYVKQDGKPEEGEPGAFDDLDDFVRFVATASDESFRTEGPQRFSQRDYENWWAFITLLVAIDSDVKNSFHYHDPKGGPWRYIPWDLDGTFGQTWKTQRLRPTAALDTGTDNEMVRRLLAEPTFAGPLKARLRAELSGELSPVLLHARLDTIAQEIGPSARRDEARWMAQYRGFPLWSQRTDFTTFDEEVEYIRQWITQRWAFLDSQLAEGPRAWAS